MTTSERDDRIDPTMRQLAEGIFGPTDLYVYSSYMKPSRRTLDWRHTALLVVDTSGAFLGPDLPTPQAVAARRTACGRPAWRALDQIKLLLKAFREAHQPVVFTMPDAEAESYYGGTTIGDAASSSATDALAPALKRRPDELLVLKAKASAFFGTPLSAFFVRHAISGICLVGGTTSGCVRASAVDASSSGLDVVLVPEACFDRSDISHRVSAFELATKYVTLATTTEVIAALSGAEPSRDPSQA